MDEHPDGSLAAFWRRFRRSPVRWVVLVHALLLITVVAVRRAYPAQGTLVMLDSSLVMAQVSLLMIWMTLDGKGTLSGLLGVSAVVTLIFAIHALPFSGEASSIVCIAPSMLVVISVLALPLSTAQTHGLQLRRFARDAMPPSRRLQFSIRSTLLTALCVALLFGIKGLGAKLGQFRAVNADGIEAALIVVMGFVGVAIYLSIPLVAVWAVLTPGKILPRLAAALAGWGMGVVLVLHYTEMGGDAIQWLMPAGVSVGAILILLTTLLVLRRLGYRAVWVDRDGWIFLDEVARGSPFESRDRVVEEGNEGGHPG